MNALRICLVRRIGCWSLPWLLVALGAPPAAGQADRAAKPARTVRLLTVGNSFSHNATRYLPDLVRAAGNVLVHHEAIIGGGTLAQHWEKAELHEKDRQDKRGLYSS